MKNTNLKKCFTASLLGIIALGGYAQVNYVEPPIMGWSSWNTYRVNINEELIKKQADAMISQGLDKVGYHFINIDDGFFGFRDEKGILHTHPQRFPNGMKRNSRLYPFAGSESRYLFGSGSQHMRFALGWR